MYEVYQLTGTAFPNINEHNWMSSWYQLTQQFGRETMGLYFSKTVGASGAAFALLVAFAYIILWMLFKFGIVPCSLPPPFLQSDNNSNE